MNALFKSAGVGDDWKRLEHGKENSGFDSGNATNHQPRIEGMHEQALWEERSGKRPRSPLVSNALNQSLSSRHTAAGLIFHSDRGSQYGSAAYRQILNHAGIRQSMSARANPYHNAWTESFIGALKTEMLQGGCFIDSSDARTEIFDYIDSYYNHYRKHSALNYQTPAQFEANLRSQLS